MSPVLLYVMLTFDALGGSESSGANVSTLNEVNLTEMNDPKEIESTSEILKTTTPITNEIEFTSEILTATKPMTTTPMTNAIEFTNEILGATTPMPKSDASAKTTKSEHGQVCDMDACENIAKKPTTLKSKATGKDSRYQFIAYIQQLIAGVKHLAGVKQLSAVKTSKTYEIKTYKPNLSDKTRMKEKYMGITDSSSHILSALFRKPDREVCRKREETTVCPSERRVVTVNADFNPTETSTKYDVPADFNPTDVSTVTSLKPVSDVETYYISSESESNDSLNTKAKIVPKEVDAKGGVKDFYSLVGSVEEKVAENLNLPDANAEAKKKIECDVVRVPLRDVHVDIELLRGSAQSVLKEDSKLEGAVESVLKQDSKLDGTVESVVKEDSKRDGAVESLVKEGSKLEEAVESAVKEDSKLEGLVEIVVKEDSKLEGLMEIVVKEDSKLKTVVKEYSKLEGTVDTVVKKESKLEGTVESVVKEDSKLEETVETLVQEGSKLEVTVESVVKEDSKIEGSVENVKEVSKLEGTVESVVKVDSKPEGSKEYTVKDSKQTGGKVEYVVEVDPNQLQGSLGNVENSDLNALEIPARTEVKLLPNPPEGLTEQNKSNPVEESADSQVTTDSTPTVVSIETELDIDSELSQTEAEVDTYYDQMELEDADPTLAPFQCGKTNPCGWTIYHRGTDKVQQHVESPCYCPPEMECRFYRYKHKHEMEEYRCMSPDSKASRFMVDEL